MTVSEVKKTSEAAGAAESDASSSSSGHSDVAAAAAETGSASTSSTVINKAMEWMHSLPSMSRLFLCTKLSPVYAFVHE